MKIVKVDEECYRNLTSYLGQLIAKKGRMLTYDDAIRELVNTRVVLPKEMLQEIEKHSQHLKAEQ